MKWYSNTSAIAAKVLFSFITSPINPSLVFLDNFFYACANPFSVKWFLAYAKSPSKSINAYLQWEMGDPVSSLNYLIKSKVIFWENWYFCCKYSNFYVLWRFNIDLNIFKILNVCWKKKLG